MVDVYRDLDELIEENNKLKTDINLWESLVNAQCVYSDRIYFHFMTANNNRATIYYNNSLGKWLCRITVKQEPDLGEFCSPIEAFKAIQNWETYKIFQNLEETCSHKQ